MKTFVDISAQPVMLSQLRAVFHRREGFVQIETVDALHSRIGNYRNGVISDHRVGLIGREFPNGQPPALFVLCEKRLDEIACTFLIDDRVERVRGAKRVPQGEDGVVCEVAAVCVLKSRPR